MGKLTGLKDTLWAIGIGICLVAVLFGLIFAMAHGYGGSSPDNVYFVDGYSCVNEREDRARIMEYFMVHEDEAGMLIESPAIRQKLQFMCDAVRNNFDTTGWSAVRWESLLR